MKPGERMEKIERNELAYPAVSPFRMQISYVEIDRRSPKNEFASHVHPECEIYLNLSGDVSFLVENRIYPIFPGNMIITRPYEYHHCVYHSDEPHKHFWILFSADGNEWLFDRFFNRRAGENNLLVFPADRQKELVALCHDMVRDGESGARSYGRFFRLLALLECAEQPSVYSENHPADLTYAIEYINSHFTEPISVQALADASFVSLHTLERHFQEVMHMTPSAYLKKKRLARAAELLYQGSTVGDACRESGFADYSNFIALFKQAYGMTPLKYKNTVT